MTRSGQPTLSRRQRVGLFVHRAADRWLSPLGVRVMRLTRGGIARPWKVNALVLTTHGRRSGRDRSVVLQFFADGDSFVVIAANDGAASHPAWYHNLKANADAQVDVEGRSLRVHAAELTGDDARDWRRRIVEIAPSYEIYERATNRLFPVMRLTRPG